ncbi:MAG: inositol monophosphatase family protein [Candidatus Burarchaeum sp.]|nr:inositol monophosphatase family protein [Candidatus Burarchaeum sp.]MDO8340267.1 inositol monophosphatase family protein [Candidatus Burarchaeum sp.]
MASLLPIYRRIAKKARTALAKSSTQEIGRNELGQETMKADRDIENVVFEELKKRKCAVLSEEAGYCEFGGNVQELFIIDPLDASENYKHGIPCYALGIARAALKAGRGAGTREGGAAGARLADVEEAFIFDLVTGDEFYAEKDNGVWRNGKPIGPSMLKEMPKAIIAIDFYNDNSRQISDSTRAKALAYPKDIRRFGPALLEMAYVACGALEGYLNVNKSLSVVHACGPALMREAGCTVTDHEGKPLDFGLREVGEYFTIVAAGNAEIHKKMMEILRD